MNLPRSSKIILVVEFLSYAASFAFPLLCTILNMRSGLSVTAVGWVMSAAFLGSAVVQPVVGRWLDRGLDARVLILSSAGFLIGILGLQFSGDLRLLLVPALMIFVTSFSSITTASFRIVEGMAPDEVRGTAALLAAAAANLGFAVSSMLAFYFLRDHQGVLLALDAVTTLGYVAMLYRFRPRLVATGPGDVVEIDVPAQVPDGSRLNTLVGVFFLFVSNAACLSAIPMLYARLGGDPWTPVMIGVSNIVVAALGIGAASWLNRLGTRFLLFSSASLFAISHSLLPLVDSQISNILLTLIWAGAEVLSYPLVARVVFACYSRREAGRGAAVKSGLMRVAMAMAPAFAALTMTRPTWVFAAVFGSIPLVGAIFMAPSLRHLKNVTPESPKRSIQTWVLEQFKKGVLVFLSLSLSIILVTSSLLMIGDKLNHLIDASRSFINSQIPNLQIYDFVRMNSDLEIFAQNKPIKSVRMLDASGTEIGRWSAGNVSDNAQETMLSISLRSGLNHLMLRRDQDQNYQLILSSSLAAPNGRRLAVIELSIAVFSFLKTFLVSIFALIMVMLVTYVIGVVLARRAARAASEPLEHLSTLLKNAQDYEDLSLVDIPTELEEVSILISRFESLSRRLKAEEDQRIQSEKLRAVGLLAAQVAHDIRSPLAALDVVLTSTSGMPEDKRMLVRSAILRIKDIANDMLSQHTPDTPEDSRAQKVCGVNLVSNLLEQIVSEKRLQFRNLLGVEIEDRLTNLSYGVFASVQPGEFQRVISNVINNSVEAFPKQHGKVLVTLTGDQDVVTLEISDNGAGIPAETLERLGAVGGSYGKGGTESGHGLGLSHAKKMVESWNGKLEIESRENSGTTVRITLPRAPTPAWFLASLELEPNGHIVIVDDDSSIHRIWLNRFKAMGVEKKGIKISHFSDPKIFATWLLSQKDNRGKKYLIDYEFIEAEQSGLDIIEAMDIAGSSTLVTSHYQDPEVAARAKQLGVAIIPKGLAGLVPIELVNAKVDAVLIDDDVMVHQVWKLWASEHGKTIDYFFSVNDFLAKTELYAKTTRIFVDSDLGAREPGERASRAIHALGFSEIYLATGYPATDFTHCGHLKGVVGKTPEAAL